MANATETPYLLDLRSQLSPLARRRGIRLVRPVRTRDMDRQEESSAWNMKERDVLRQILDYLAVKHIFAFRINTGAFFDGGRAFRSHSLGSGAADILAQRSEDKTLVWIECKSMGSRQMVSQKRFQQWVEGLGQVYVVAHSIDDLTEVF